MGNSDGIALGRIERRRAVDDEVLRDDANVLGVLRDDLINCRVDHVAVRAQELEALVMSGRFHHDGDPVLARADFNVEVMPDSATTSISR